MKQELLFVGLLASAALADRFTDFDSNYAWWTDLDAVETDTLGYRRTCFVGVYDNNCDVAGTWEKMRSIALPSTIETSYSGTVTAYSLCRQFNSGQNRYFYKFVSGGSCDSGWTRITGLNLITDETGWSNSFTVGSNTWYRRDFYVYANSYGHLMVPSKDLAPNLSLYSFSFSFSAYWKE